MVVFVFIVIFKKYNNILLMTSFNLSLSPYILYCLRGIHLMRREEKKKKKVKKKERIVNIIII